ncbi:unnamed protein product [Acanthosepion pharaonis]|uniref:Uncharacterized protein n=1 Tax=Acanthosepion pharaonis TaxID=158019 RepID=A0A812E192_ACAPH|nr:unnamed protein product [Sepia pharaonis]
MPFLFFFFLLFSSFVLHFNASLSKYFLRYINIFHLFSSSFSSSTLQCFSLQIHFTLPFLFFSSCLHQLTCSSILFHSLLLPFATFSPAAPLSPSSSFLLSFLLYIHLNCPFYIFKLVFFSFLFFLFFPMSNFLSTHPPLSLSLSLFLSFFLSFSLYITVFIFIIYALPFLCP